MNYQWTENTKPDRPGIWMQKGIRDPFVVPSPVGNWDVDTYCFICDLPTIVDPPKYRPIREGDERKTIQVDGQPAFLIGFSRDDETAVYERGARIATAIRERCRILDDGQPKREPREWWFVKAKDAPNEWIRCEEKQWWNGEQIHVREVIE